MQISIQIYIAKSVCIYGLFHRVLVCEIEYIYDKSIYTLRNPLFEFCIFNEHATIKIVNIRIWISHALPPFYPCPYFLRLTFSITGTTLDRLFMLRSISDIDH